MSWTTSMACHLNLNYLTYAMLMELYDSFCVFLTDLVCWKCRALDSCGLNGSIPDLSGLSSLTTLWVPHCLYVYRKSTLTLYELLEGICVHTITLYWVPFHLQLLCGHKNVSSLQQGIRSIISLKWIWMLNWALCFHRI